MTREEIEHVEECVYHAVTQATRHIVEQHADVSREVMISMSPLEKFEGKQVKVSTFDRMWIGTLTSFCCGSWVELKVDGESVIIYTGHNTSVQLK
jgi:hypothetical protein